jgi:hypothetical protein
MKKQIKKTTAPIDAANICRNNPEFLRTNDVHTYFGIKKGTLYNLSNLGKIRGVTLRPTGGVKGVRLWNVESIRSYIESQKEQADDDIWTVE